MRRTFSRNSAHRHPKVRTAFYRGHLRQTVELRESLIKSAVNGSNPAQQELIKFIKSQQQYLEYE